MVQLNMSDQFARIGDSVRDFFSFVLEKLQNFPGLMVGEQIAYSVVGVGILCLLVSLVLWII